MDIKSILQRYWGYSKFRTLQEDIIQSVLSGKDTLALLPTGGGKSICFQVATMAQEGICLVITPLIALMKDQVENLQKRDIPALAIHTGMHQREIELCLSRCVRGEVKFLYLSPERLKNTLTKNSIQQMDVCLLAVDEAHCISQWGYDFRPPYLEIANIRTLFTKSVPLLALTATATPQVVKDIQQNLAFKQENVFQKSYMRENLTYFTIKIEDKLKRLLTIANKTPGSGIVYVRSRKKTIEISNFLKANKQSSDYFHAGLDVKTREQKQKMWMQGKIRIMVATNAFGMGIDKSEVRFVVHMDIPDSLEAYFQEAGRAGRDEKRSYAILLYEDADIYRLQTQFEASYPGLNVIQDVYQALGNYFRIPIGNGEGLSFEFNNNDFADIYRMNPITTYHALKFIEKTGLIVFTDPYSNSSKLYISSSREDLYRFQVENPQYDSMIKLLLRSYSGFFTGFIPIYETELAKKAHIEIDRIIAVLKKLHQIGILIYEQQTELPRIVFLENRLESKYLVLSESIYQKRVKTAKARLDAVIQYVSNQTKCRSQQLLAYFGETESVRCGKCDVCIERNKIELSSLEFDNILNDLKPVLLKQDASPEELVELTHHPEEKVVKVIRWLLDNDKIKYTSEKKLRWHEV